MRTTLATLIAGLFATSVFAQTTPAADTQADAKADKDDAKADKMSAADTHK